MLPAEQREDPADARVKKIMQVCLRHKGCAKEYFVAPIPDHKVASARESLRIPTSERAIALIDFTVFGGAKEALVVTEGGICWRRLGEQPTRLSWAQLRGRSIKKNHGFVFQDIDFGNGLKLNLQDAQELGRNQSDVVLSLLQELAALDHVAGAGAGASAGSTTPTTKAAAQLGMIECEFCQGEIKPDVTYCKHCGIKLKG